MDRHKKGSYPLIHAGELSCSRLTRKLPPKCVCRSSLVFLLHKRNINLFIRSLKTQVVSSISLAARYDREGRAVDLGNTTKGIIKIWIRTVALLLQGTYYRPFRPASRWYPFSRSDSVTGQLSYRDIPILVCQSNPCHHGEDDVSFYNRNE
jgi:hypothetical protein